jgi:hypothetical protein
VTAETPPSTIPADDHDFNVSIQGCFRIDKDQLCSVAELLWNELEMAHLTDMGAQSTDFLVNVANLILQGVLSMVVETPFENHA